MKRKYTKKISSFGHSHLTGPPLAGVQNGIYGAACAATSGFAAWFSSLSTDQFEEFAGGFEGLPIGAEQGDALRYGQVDRFAIR